MKKNKSIYVTECKSLYPGSSKQLKRWHQDLTLYCVFESREDALESCLQNANRYKNWQYRVVRYDRGPVEVFK